MTYAEPLKRIRREVFSETQATFAAIVGVTQATISKWEKGKLVPEIVQMSKIREEAMKRGIAWDDDWFFHLPSEAA